MTHGSLFAGIEGFGVGMEEAGWQTSWQVEQEPFCLAVLETHFPAALRGNDIRTCRGLPASLLASLAKMSRLQVEGLALRESELDSFITLRESCESFDPLGLSSKMFPDYSVRTRAETLQKSSGFSWSGAGMGFRGVCSTRNFSVSPNVANVSSLSEVLEDHVPQRFYLSPRACRGVLRRAEKRKRTLLSRLQAALEFVGSLQDDEWKTITTWLFSRSPQDTTGTHPTEETVTRLLSRVQARERARLLPQPTNDTTKTPTLSLRQRSTQAEIMAASERKQGSISFAKRSAPKDHDGVEKIKIPISSAPSTPRMEDTTPNELRLDTIWLVRRLTPTECETLQGFPKGWTVPDTERWGTRSQRKSLSGSAGESSKRKKGVGETRKETGDCR